MKRLCIYLTYDSQNIVDAYIGYMLNELKTCADYLVVVCNESEIVRGKEILEKYANAIFFRENKGFDAGGFKDALCKYLGWEKVLAFDELVLANDSFFGPFRPMVEIFEEMSRKHVDFWGLSKHGERIENSVCYPEHLQSFFLTIRKKMLHSKLFRKYWEDMPYYKNLGEVVSLHESRFTCLFFKHGFTFDCLANMTINDSARAQNNYNQYAMLSYELIAKRNFPFLKKQPLAWNTLNSQTQENLRLALEYIDKHTDYAVNMIWENILRTFNISDLQRTLRLQYIIPSTIKESVMNQNIAVVVVVSYMEAYENVLEYLDSLNGCCIIKIFSQNQKILDLYSINGYHCIDINGVGDYKHILEELGKFEIVCIIHDVDVTGKHDLSCTGKSYFFNIWNNLLKSASHISWIVEKFRKEAKLGLLVPPAPNFGKYFGDLENRWGDNFEKVKCAIERMQLNCRIDYKKPPFSHSSNFWIRGRILKEVSKKEIPDIYILPYIWCYIAQDAGYYSGIVESEEYAAMNEINLQYYVNTIAAQLGHQCGKFCDFSEMQRKITEGILKGYCTEIEHLYVYGTGIVAERYQHMLSRVEAYIVSDGQPKKEYSNGKRVLYLSEVEVREDAAIIVCLSEENQKQVVPLLKERGWRNYLCV